MALKIVTLEDLKGQMRIDFEEEDNLITVYGEAAEAAVVNATRRSVEELMSENEKRTGISEFPPALYVAILMMAAQLYRSREPVSGLSQVLVPYTYDYLVKPWIKLVK
jgi:uncharacterized phage protein (predicted DNA packaging)|nr:MAG TPA: Head Tail Connector Protein [Caudoviricetes sp.]